MLSNLKGYIFLVLIGGISQLGSSITVFALNVWAWQTYHIVGALAEVTAAFFIPLLIFTPIAGIFVDRWNRKKILVFANVGLLLAIIPIIILALNGNLLMWHIYLFGISHSILNSFYQPALMSIMSTMVKADQLKRVNGFVQMIKSVSFFSGPLIGALLVSSLGIEGAFMFDAFSFFISALGTCFITVPIIKRSKNKNVKSAFLVIFKDLWTGWNFILKDKTLRPLVLLDSLANFFSGFLSVLLLPMSSLFWKNTIDSSWLRKLISLLGSGNNFEEKIYGLTGTIMFIGVFFGSILMTTTGGFKKNSSNLFFGFVMVGISRAFVGSEHFLIAIIAVFMCGLTGPLVNVSMLSIYMSKTPNELQGRILSTEDTLSQISYPIGLYVVSAMSNTFSPNIILIISGISASILCGLCFLNPRLRKIDSEI